MSIAENLRQVLDALADHPGAKLIAVVKNRPVAEIQELIDAGADRIAFNRVQEAAEKFPQLDFGGTKHLIGHLQKNKAKRAVELFDWIQSVDSVELAQKLDAEAKKAGKKMSVLFQVNVADDPAKYGFQEEEILKEAAVLAELGSIIPRGLMTIGKLNADSAEIHRTFRKLRHILQILQQKNVFGPDFRELSMGMSSDFRQALREGATIVRVGSGLFGGL